MRLRGARRFQMGGANNPVLAAGATPASPSGVNPLPPVNMGGPAGGPFQAAAPAAGLGAAAPGLNPAAIQQAMALRRMQAGMGAPGAAGAPGAGAAGLQGMVGGVGGAPGMGAVPGGAPGAAPANPLAQQLMARGAVPMGGAGGPTGAPNPQAMQAVAQAMQARGATPTPVPMGGGAPTGPAANPAIAQMLAANPGLVGAGMGFARGGEVVAPQWGDTDHITRRARGGRISKFNSTKAAPENLPTHPGAEKKAKGGVLKRRPKAKKMPPQPPAPPYGDDQTVPPPAASPAAAAASMPAPMPPAPAGPPPGMRRGGRWKGGAVAKKKGGAVRRRPPGDEGDRCGPDDTEAMASGGKWIQKAIKKPGALHAQLGVPKGEKIPAKKLAKAAKASGKLGERARMAETLKKMNKAKGGKCEDKDKDGMRAGGKCKMAAGGAAKQRKGFPKTIAPLRRAEGGRIRGCGAATKGCKFSGIY